MAALWTSLPHISKFHMHIPYATIWKPVDFHNWKSKVFLSFFLFWHKNINQSSYFHNTNLHGGHDFSSRIILRIIIYSSIPITDIFLFYLFKYLIVIFYFCYLFIHFIWLFILFIYLIHLFIYLFLEGGHIDLQFLAYEYSILFFVEISCNISG